MKTSILGRLVASHLLILIVMTVVGAHTFLEFRHFRSVSVRLIDIENRIGEQVEQFGNSLLSQVRYNKKYVILRDTSLHEQFLIVGTDAEKQLDLLASLADDKPESDLVEKIKADYGRYVAVVKDEAENLLGNRAYAQKKLSEEKDSLVNQMSEGLKKLRVSSQFATYERLKKLGEAEAAELRAALIFGGLAALAAILIALLITRSITKPIAVLVNKTREIAHGIFVSDLTLASPIELAKLSSAINTMCDRLKAVDKMKTDFFSTMSHELRTPLASVKEGTSLLLDGVGGGLTDKQQKLLRIIAEESERVIGLINSLLDLSKMEAGMMPFDISRSDIVPLIRRTVGALDPLALAKNVTIVVDMQEGLPAVPVDGDRIIQALQNLIGNAIKFTKPGGQVTIRAEKHETGLVVAVADTGPGISREDIPRIFEKYQQAGSASAHKIKGTGLGLAIVKYIVLAHGGRVWAESEVGKGSTFFFSLPS